MIPVMVDGACFLGSGAFGQVFAVQDAPSSTKRKARLSKALNELPMALKLVLNSSVSDVQLDDTFKIEGEHAVMRRAFEIGAPVIEPAPDSFQRFDDLGTAFLMLEVGRPFQPKSEADSVLSFKCVLGLHKKGITHNDPRVENITKIHSGELRLIDAVEVTRPFTNMKLACQRDVEILASSILQCKRNILPTNVQAAIAKYDHDIETSAEELGKVVWAARCSKRD